MPIQPLLGSESIVRAAPQKLWMCALCFRRYSLALVGQLRESARLRLPRDANPHMIVKATQSHNGSEAIRKSKLIRYHVVDPLDEAVLPEKLGKGVSTPISIRKFPTIAPENVYSALSLDRTHLIRKRGRPLGEAEDSQQVLESVLETFDDIQLSASRKAVAHKSSDSVLPSRIQGFSKGKATRRRNAVTGNRGLANSQRRIPVISLAVGSSKQYATAAAHETYRNASPNPPFEREDVRLRSALSGGNIREHLRIWQEQHEIKTKLVDSVAPLSNRTPEASQNLYTQSREDDSSRIILSDEEGEDHSDTQVEPDIDDHSPTLLSRHGFLRRGDLVDVKTGSKPILAIFVRHLVSQFQFYTINGEWVNRLKGEFMFAVPGFVHPTELDELMPYLPEEEVEGNRIDNLQPLKANAPREAGAKLIAEMTLFQQAADSVFRSNADRLNRVYELIAPMNPSDGPSQKGLREIALRVMQKNDPAELTQAMLCAVHRAMIGSQNIIRLHSYDCRNPQFEIHTQESWRQIAQVREWVRAYQEGVTEDVTESFHVDPASILTTRSQNPITTFVQKARAAIEQSRRLRPISPRGGLGPSFEKVEPVAPDFRVYREIPGQLFDENEKVIIHYLDAWIAARYITEVNLESLGPMILRATGKYNSLGLSREVGLNFLQELGILTPWADRSGFSFKGMRLPGHGLVCEGTTQLERKAQQWAENHFPSGSTGSVLKLEDCMRTLRRDWGDLPVFCIDSAGTLDHDDGISLQPVESSPSEYWVHVHVANPSAFIPPDSPVSDYAAHLSQTVYLPARKYTMLPPYVTDVFFSLAKDRPCLTFSARMSSEGDILEKAIHPGIVRNVHYLTPHSVAQALELDTLEEPETVPVLSVGGKPPTDSYKHEPKTSKVLEDSHVKILRKLFDLSQASFRKRISNGAVDYRPTMSRMRVPPKVFLSQGLEELPHVKDSGIRQYEGDPIISLEMRTGVISRATAMVQELMIIAGSVAASWCMERNIPILYRGVERNPEPMIPPEEYKRNSPNFAAHDKNVLKTYMRLLGHIGLSASPLEHVTLALPAYSKVTSPLRRYVDLYTHWQIEAGLRYEARTGTSSIGSSDNSYLPFSWAEVNDCATTAITREGMVKQLTMGSETHWVVQTLHRAFYFKEAPLPETFIVESWGIRGTRQFGEILEYRARCYFEESDVSKQAGGIQEGDLWESKINFIDAYFLVILMTPIRLVARKTQMLSKGKEADVL